MPPKRPEARQLQAAFGEAFATLKRAKDQYRDGASSAQQFVTAFFALCAGDDALAARSDALLSLVGALLPPDRRPALRDPAIVGRARAAALEAHGAGPLTVTLKSLQGPPIQLQLSREDRIDDVRARACAAAGTRPGWSARLLVSGAALEDGRTVGEYDALADGATIHMLAMRPQPEPEPEPEPEPQSLPEERFEAEERRRLRQEQMAQQCEADRLLALALASADAEEPDQPTPEAGSDGGRRFSEEDDDGRSDTAEAAAGEEPAAEPAVSVEALAEEISSAQAQTAWTGCPEAYALAVSGVGDSELAQRVRSAVKSIAATRAFEFAEEFSSTLAARKKGGWLHRHPPASAKGAEWEPCLGCGEPSSVKIVKRCGCCTERDECRCAPQWCSSCLLKWWLSQNQRRIEKSTPAPGVGMIAMGIDPRWGAKCPTCRASFCLNDIIPAETVAPGPPRGASKSGTLVYTVGHGQPPISSSDSDDDDSPETAAERTRLRAARDKEAAAAFAQWAARIAAIDDAPIGGLLDVRSDDQLASLPPCFRAPETEALCKTLKLRYKRVPSVDGRASAQDCIDVARSERQAPWALLGVPVEWHGCSRGLVADELLGLDAHRVGDTMDRAHGGGGLGLLQGASRGKGKGKGKAGKDGVGDEQAQWLYGLESQALAVQTRAKASAGKKSRRRTVLDTVAIVFHHLLDETKRGWILEWAEQLDLGGISKPGHPGVVIVEGAVDAVDSFIQRIRSDNIKWKSMEMACEEQIEGKKGEPLDDLRKFRQFAEIIRWDSPVEPEGRVRMLEREMTAEALSVCEGVGHGGIIRRALEMEARFARQQPPTEREGRRVRVGVSRRLRMRLSIAEERVKADARQSTQLTMLRQETDRYR